METRAHNCRTLQDKRTRTKDIIILVVFASMIIGLKLFELM